MTKVFTYKGQSALTYLTLKRGEDFLSPISSRSRLAPEMVYLALQLCPQVCFLSSLMCRFCLCVCKKLPTLYSAICRHDKVYWNKSFFVRSRLTGNNWNNSSHNGLKRYKFILLCVKKSGAGVGMLCPWSPYAQVPFSSLLPSSSGETCPQRWIWLLELQPFHPFSKQ